MRPIISYYVHDSSFYLVLVTYRKTYVEKKLHNDEWPLRCICEQAFISWIKSSVNWKRSNRTTYAWKKKSALTFFESNGKKAKLSADSVLRFKDTGTWTFIIIISLDTVRCIRVHANPDAVDSRDRTPLLFKFTVVSRLQRVSCANTR